LNYAVSLLRWTFNVPNGSLQLQCLCSTIFHRNSDALSEPRPENEETTNLASTTSPLSDEPALARAVAITETGLITREEQRDLGLESQAPQQIGAGAEISRNNQKLTEPEADNLEGTVERPEQGTSWQTAMGAFSDEGKDVNPPARDVVFKTLQH
jgi:hypothetical protein